MKKLFTLIALGSVTFVSADQYENEMSSFSSDGNYYQDPNSSNYYQQNQRQSSQKYFQDDDQNWQRNNAYNYQQQSPRNQAYDQNQQYYRQPSNQSYDRDQQRNYDNTYRVQTGENLANSDQEISRKIKDKLSSGWFSKGFQNVSFDVRNGYVYLKGSVETLDDKNKVEDSVKKIDGVKQVNNQISIMKENPNTYSKENVKTYSDSELQDSEKKYPQDMASSQQDRQLNARIRHKLSSGWFSKGYETLVIRTNNGFVIISGTVDKPEDVQKITDQVKNIEGVRSLNHQLTVKNR